MSDPKVIEIYTDGGCRGNPGPGGWGVLLRYQGKEKTLYGSERHTTNNRMELMAAIEALAALKAKPSQVTLTTDSKYVQDGISKWIHGWKKNGWKTANRKPVKNCDLWKRLDELAQQHDVRWHWIKGHSGHPENEIADALANLAIDKLLGLA